MLCENYKIFRSALRSLKALSAPHYAGLFDLGLNGPGYQGGWLA